MIRKRQEFIYIKEFYITTEDGKQKLRNLFIRKTKSFTIQKIIDIYIILHIITFKK